MLKKFVVPLLLCLLILNFPACSRDNGLSADMLKLLASRGISVKPVSSSAPLSSRSGYLVLGQNPELLNSIISKLNLEKLQPEERRWQFAMSRLSGSHKVSGIWGVSGRPASLKLGNGGQFEYCYLIETGDGFLYLLAEYAYS